MPGIGSLISEIDVQHFRNVRNHKDVCSVKPMPGFLSVNSWCIFVFNKPENKLMMGGEVGDLGDAEAAIIALLAAEPLR